MSNTLISKKTLRKRRISPYGGKPALPLPKPRPPLDSSPTPVLELGYRDLSAKFLLLASRFDSEALVLSKNIQKLDIAASKECRRIADNIREIAARIANWPNMKLSPNGQAAEKSWAAEQFITFMDIFQEMVGERPTLRI